jgi:hypothetical protein
MLAVSIHASKGIDNNDFCYWQTNRQTDNATPWLGPSENKFLFIDTCVVHFGTPQWGVPLEFLASLNYVITKFFVILQTWFKKTACMKHQRDNIPWLIALSLSQNWVEWTKKSPNTVVPFAATFGWMYLTACHGVHVWHSNEMEDTVRMVQPFLFLEVREAIRSYDLSQ